MNITKKIVASIVGLSMVMTVAPAGVAQGQTVEELQAQIAALTAQLAALQSQLAALTGGTKTYAGVPAGFTFTKELRSGMKDGDVVYLKIILAAENCVSGLANNNYFGSKTLAGVKCFQTKYGLSATGVVDSATRAKLNALLAPVTPPTPPTPPPPQEEPVEVEEGVLSADLAPVPIGVDIRPGETKAVAAFTVKAEGSAINIKRINLDIRAMKSTTAYRPWNYLSHIALYDGEKAIKGMDVVRANFTALPNDFWQVRFLGLDLKVDKGTTKTITVKVTTLSVIDSVTLDSIITVRVPKDGIRGVDTAGLSQLASYPSTVTNLDRVFNVKGIISGELKVRPNVETPTEGVVLVSETALTSDVELLKFDVTAKVTSVTVDNVTVKIRTRTTPDDNKDPSKVASYLKLYDGTTLLGTKPVPSTLTETEVTFDKLKLAIAKDATKVLTVKADILEKGTGKVLEGDNIVASIAEDKITGEDAYEKVILSDGSATGNKIYLYTAAPVISAVSTTITPTIKDTAGNILAADGKIAFTLTAQGGDITIPTGGITAAPEGTNIVVVTGTTLVLVDDKTLPVTVEAGKSVRVVVEGRIAHNVSTTSRGWFKVGKVEWNIGTAGPFALSPELIKALKTDSVLLYKAP